MKESSAKVSDPESYIDAVAELEVEDTIETANISGMHETQLLKSLLTPQIQ